MDKKCSLCKVRKPNNWYWNNAATRDGLDGQCKPCRRGTNRKYKRKQRAKLITLMGGECNTCGYKGSALQVDHVNNDGHLERNEAHGYSQAKINRAYKVDPSRFQLLCSNCKWEKRVDI